MKRKRGGGGGGKELVAAAGVGGRGHFVWNEEEECGEREGD